MQASVLTETPFQAASAELAHNDSSFADMANHQSTPGYFAPQSASFDGCEPSTAETASTPLAVAALAAMGLDLGNAAEHRSRCVVLALSTFLFANRTEALSTTASLTFFCLFSSVDTVMNSVH